MTGPVRYILAVVTGAVIAFALVVGVEAVGHAIYPPPPGIDFTNADAVRAYIGTLPTGAFAFVLAASALGTFAGAWAATRIAGVRSFRFAGLVGAIVLAASVANFVTIPHPTWFMVVTFIAIPVAASVAGRLAHGARP